MKTLADIAAFLQNELSQYAFNNDDLDVSLGLSIGTINKILDEQDDYTIAALIAVLDRFGYEIAIFDKNVLRRLMEGPNGLPAELKVKTGAQVALDKLRAASEPR
jgi:hypothetical protein